MLASETKKVGKIECFYVKLEMLLALAWIIWEPEVFRVATGKTRLGCILPAKSNFQLYLFRILI